MVDVFCVIMALSIIAIKYTSMAALSKTGSILMGQLR